MRFLTLEAYTSWYGSYQDDSHVQEAFHRYTAHLGQLEGSFSPGLLALARLPGVDDGLLFRAEHFPATRALTMALRCGDQIAGYYDLILSYDGAEISPDDEQTLARIARSTRSHCRHESDLFFHELDVLDGGGIEHRLLFHPGVWFAIQCQALSWQQVPRPDRTLPRLRDRFQVR